MLDLLLCAGTVLAFGYVVLNHDEIIFRAGIATLPDIILGVVAIVIVLEGTRRTTGWALVILAVIFLLYGFYGQYLPRSLGGHGGFTFQRIITEVYLSLNGVFGIVTYVIFKYVVLFVLFGKILEQSGAMNFVMNLAQALVGRICGGPAMVAVVSSGMMGTVSGSPLANVMITGTITIPLMKKIGFKPHVAGAVEAAASTGGQFMPPVMGASAFLIMEFLGISYIDVIKAAFIPAALYFSALFAAVYVYSRRSGLRGLPSGELPRLGQVLRQREALPFVGGIVVLLAFLIHKYSPMMAAIYAMATAVLLSQFSEKRINVRRAVVVLHKGAGDFAGLSAACATVSIIVALTLLSGLAVRFSSLVISIAGGQLYLILISCMVASMILGMGMPTAIAYVILAITVAPALIEMGVLPLAAHLFIFYSGIMAMITPPVALTAYAAATIAEANFWRTGFQAAILGLPAYLLPYAFVMDSSLLMMGSPLRIVLSIATAALGVVVLSFALIGRLRSRLEMLQRVLLLAGSILLIMPRLQLSILGLAITIAAVLPSLKAPKQWAGATHEYIIRLVNAVWSRE